MAKVSGFAAAMASAYGQSRIGDGAQVDGDHSLPVSLIITAYNAAGRLEREIDALRAESPRPAELIVVDQGSTDATCEIARRLGVRLFTAEKRSVAAARNLGARHARSRWLAFLDADDAASPARLARQRHALAGQPHAAFAVSDIRGLDGLHNDEAQNSRGVLPVGGNALAKALRRTATFADLPLMVARETFDLVGGYDESLDYRDDLDLVFRLCAIADAVYLAELGADRHLTQAKASGAGRSSASAG